MKKKLSVTIEESILDKIDNEIKDKVYRNKSHYVEIALSEFIRKKE